MKQTAHASRNTSIEREDSAFRDAMHLLEIESSPLSQEAIEMFDEFHREGLSHAECLNRIRARSLERTAHNIADAAE